MTIQEIMDMIDDNPARAARLLHADINRLRTALHNIKTHQEIVTKELSMHGTVWQIAHKALENNGTR